MESTQRFAVTSKSERSLVSLDRITFGGPRFVVIAGPCSVESHSVFAETSAFVVEHGASVLRGGVFKMRTDPSSFQGLGAEAAQIAKQVKSKLGVPFVTEVTDPRQIADLAPFVDAFQVGSRNMHNYYLLKELGQHDKPVILKRGFAGLIKEWLLSAEYISQAGNKNIILCERGIRTFETETRNTLDLNAVPAVKSLSSLPIIVDPSHGTGRRDFVVPMALAAAAAGADGIMVEVHPDPSKALSDGFQALTFDDFRELMEKLKLLLPVLGRTL